MTMMSASQLHEVSALTRRRLDGWPVQYVLGEWDFRDLTLRMEPPVFIPRPETEVRGFLLGGLSKGVISLTAEQQHKLAFPC